MENRTTRTGNFHNDPDFVSASTFDFNLKAGSPAIGAARADAALTVDVFALYHSTFGVDIREDFERMTRPQGGTWDIGAYEFSEAAAGPSLDIIPGSGKVGPSNGRVF